MLALVRSQRGRCLVLGARLHPERREHGDQGRLGDVDVFSRPVLVFDGDAVAAGEFA
jgi:hypothetical protein